MGCWMTYQRARDRTGLRVGKFINPVNYNAIADLDRMEEDYLNPVYPQPPNATRPPSSDPSAECAARTGIDIEDVRAVLHFVFREQR